jgi:hypothetical protein
MTFAEAVFKRERAGCVVHTLHVNPCLDRESFVEAGVRSARYPNARLPVPLLWRFLGNQGTGLVIPSSPHCMQ